MHMQNNYVLFLAGNTQSCVTLAIPTLEYL